MVVAGAPDGQPEAAVDEELRAQPLEQAEDAVLDHLAPCLLGLVDQHRLEPVPLRRERLLPVGREQDGHPLRTSSGSVSSASPIQPLSSP